MKPSEAFIDEVTLSVASGRGGDGCVSLRREKFVPRGGPDGGDGGRGGDVILVADRNLATLLDHKMKRKVHAEPGAPGAKRNMTGRDGADVEIRVPVGTAVIELGDEGERLLADLTEDGQRLLVARGGRGGRGNAQFATATRQTPDFAEPGRDGESHRLRLSLKLLADVGLIGFPNAGKSTLLRRISAARPRVAAYPFTTLVPSLGVVEVDERRLVVADIPGLIEGASDGAGLGDRFLRHIERTRVLIHLIDGGALLTGERDPLQGYDAIRSELGAYSPAMLERTELVAVNKSDLFPDSDALDAVTDALRARGLRVFRISGVTGEGLEELMRAAADAVDAAETEGSSAAEASA
jgi:GTP-binding protein